MDKFYSFIKKNKKFLLEILGVFFIFFIYEICVLVVDDNVIFPNISYVFKGLYEMLQLKTTYEAFGFSLLRTFLGLLISFSLAFILGSLAGLFKGFRYFLKPTINLLKLMPTPCLVFIIFLLFFNDLPFGALIVTFVVIFPILYESFISGIDNIPEGVKLSLKLEGYTKPRSYFKVILPEAMPHLILGTTNSIGLGIKVSIMSEILLGSSKVIGIGELINTYKIDSEYNKMFATILIVVVIFLIFDIFINILKKFVLKIEKKDI